MNYTMKPVTAPKVNRCHQPLLASVHLHPSFFSTTPISSLSFSTHPPSSFSCTAIRTSYSGFSEKNKDVKFNFLDENLNPHCPRSLVSLPASFLRTTLVATATAAALFFCRFCFLPVKPVIAAPTSVTVEIKPEETEPDIEKEKSLEEYLVTHPNDLEALRNLMEIKIKNQKPNEAISIVEKLIELEPKEQEWPLMKSHLLIYTGEIELAKKGFNEIIAKDPFQVGAYHGLAMAVSQDESIEELKGIEKRIQEAVKLCKKENKKNDVRDFKLLLAQIRVMEGNYSDALKIYEELVKEEPRDFRPYLCQGIIYTLLRKKDEAEKNFEKYRRLVPKNHPYGKFFEDNMIATKIFGQKVESERADSTS